MSDYFARAATRTDPEARPGVAAPVVRGDAASGPGALDHEDPPSDQTTVVTRPAIDEGAVEVGSPIRWPQHAREEDARPAPAGPVPGPPVGDGRAAPPLLLPEVQVGSAAPAPAATDAEPVVPATVRGAEPPGHRIGGEARDPFGIEPEARGRPERLAPPALEPPSPATAEPPLATTEAAALELADAVMWARDEAVVAVVEPPRAPFEPRTSEPVTDGPAVVIDRLTIEVVDDRPPGPAQGPAEGVAPPARPRPGPTALIPARGRFGPGWGW